MSNILKLIQAERDRIRAKRGVQDLEPERYLSILVEEIGEAAQAINDWRENKGYIRDAMEEMIQVCAVAIDMYERLSRLVGGDVRIMMDTWGRAWIDRFEAELKNEYDKGTDHGKYTAYRRGCKGIEFCYEFVSSPDRSKTLLYTIDLKQIERDRTSSSQKVQEVIESVRSDLLREDNEDETK